ncbi:uncharacterized protein G2W53_025779 [Senna tora]|uniref:Uncharacterized protein n=1 Tax=Senna tora TaxID=362788 RepID=A0A834WKM0_9FABA|nr:uncharacterized protein G2W53_025779 [Senna tora]
MNLSTDNEKLEQARASKDTIPISKRLNPRPCQVHDQRTKIKFHTKNGENNLITTNLSFLVLLICAQKANLRVSMQSFKAKRGVFAGFLGSEFAKA